MSRDDSDLYTGISSAMGLKVSAERRQSVKRALDAKADLQPSGNDLLVLVATHKLQIADRVMAIINSETTSETDAKVIYAAGEMNRFLAGFESEVKRILRERPEVSDEE